MPMSTDPKTQIIVNQSAMTERLHELPTIVQPTDQFAEANGQCPDLPGYEVIRLHGRGGMSNVYLAQQKGLNRLVAIKMIRQQDSFNEHARKRFLREATAIAALQHPNVVQIFEIGVTKGMHYLCLEYVAGGDLDQKLRDGLPTARQAAQIVEQLAMAIQAAHDREIIHRDLKPANVLLVDPQARFGLTVGDEKEAPIAVKLSDFGLAKILNDGSNLSHAGYAIGTPSYMPPEQANGSSEECGKRSDIYGLGTILYALLTGLPPFRGGTTQKTLRMVHMEAPRPPSQINASVPLELEAVCQKCLEKRIDDRYGSATELAADLRRFLDGMPVSVHRISPFRRWLRHCRRHPRRAIAFLGLMLIAIGCLAGLYLLNEAREGLKKKEREVDESRERGSSLDTGDASASWPADVRQALTLAREDPMSIKNARLLADLGEEWLAKLAHAFPEDFAVQFALGDAYLFRKRPDDALRLFNNARQIAEEPSALGEGNSTAWANLATVHERLGDVHAAKNNRLAALNEYGKTDGMLQSLLDADETRPCALALASVCRKQAELYIAENDFRGALNFALHRVDLLIKQYIDDPSLGREVAEAHELIAQIHQRLGNAEEAAKHLRESKKLLRMP